MSGLEIEKTGEMYGCQTITTGLPLYAASVITQNVKQLSPEMEKMPECKLYNHLQHIQKIPNSTFNYRAFF